MRSSVLVLLCLLFALQICVNGRSSKSFGSGHKPSGGHGKSHNEADEEDYLYGDDDEESEEADQPGVLARSLRSSTNAGVSKNVSFAVIWFSTWVTVMRGFAILS
nr:unnamed protein product [Spirometra erinaceieuropaei]